MRATLCIPSDPQQGSSLHLGHGKPTVAGASFGTVPQPLPDEDGSPRRATYLAQQTERARHTLARRNTMLTALQASRLLLQRRGDRVPAHMCEVLLLASVTVAARVLSAMRPG